MKPFKHLLLVRHRDRTSLTDSRGGHHGNVTQATAARLERLIGSGRYRVGAAVAFAEGWHIWRGVRPFCEEAETR